MRGLTAKLSALFVFKSRKLKKVLVFSSLIRTFGFAEDRLHLENKNKCRFILYFARFALSLTSSKVLSLEKIQIKFGFLLAYSYLCNANQQSA